MRRLAAALALAISLVVHTGVEAATLDLRVTDKLDLGAPSVSNFAPGTNSVVAAAPYRDFGRGQTIDFALLDSSGAALAKYSESVWEGGSGTVLARLIAPAPLAPGTYRVQASSSGVAPIEVSFTVGAPGAAPAETPGAGGPPGAGGAAGGPAPVQAPVQLGAARRAAPAPPAELLVRSVAPDVRPSSPNPQSPTPNPRWGLANVLPDGTTIPGAPASGSVAWMARARDAGAGANRWEFRWEEIERAPGVYDWSAADRVIAANDAAGLPLLAILIGTPAWAGAAAGAPPSGLDAPPILADGAVNGANPWGRFVHAMAERYRGKIAAYEIWNEPNSPDFWTGSPADYYRLLATAMASIRHADGSAKVVFGGLDGYRDPSFLDGVLAVAAADPAPPGRRGAFDVLAWHAYHRPSDAYVGTWTLRDRLRARGLSQPIWITETNVAAWDDRRVRGDAAAPYRWSATADEQATYVLETFAYALAADVERVFLYRASDTGEGEAWGLLQVDGTARPAERAFRFAAEALAGATRARRVEDPGVERIVVERPGQRVTVAWATGPSDAPLVFDAASAAPALLRDKLGGVGSVAPVDGKLILSLPGASANQGAHSNDYLIGGDPYVIVESLP